MLEIIWPKTEPESEQSLKTWGGIIKKKTWGLQPCPPAALFPEQWHIVPLTTYPTQPIITKGVLLLLSRELAAQTKPE